MAIEQTRRSGKTRARQIARILGQALSPKESVVGVSGLGPLDDVDPVAQKLDETAQPAMLVGHLPFMERLAGRLLGGDPDQPVIDFTNAGIVCLEKGEERWQARWIVTPEIAAVNR